MRARAGAHLIALAALASSARGLCIGVASVRRALPVSACAPAPADEIITFSETGMRRLLELHASQGGAEFVVRMGVRDGNSASENGEYSYLMEPTTADAVTEEDVEVRISEGIRCVVDAPSLKYIRGLVVDYSDAVIRGGFLFTNPNAKKTCGCSRTFDVKEDVVSGESQ